MIISVNWLRQLTGIETPVDELAIRIGARLVEIEEVISLGEKYEGAIVAEVMSCEKLEGSDHLNVTLLDDNGMTEGVERDENGLVQVVCGAPNVRQGLKVAWLPPGSTVPATANASEPFVLGARKLRGVMSHGMIASAEELDFYSDHVGIMEIDPATRPGTLLAAAFDLNDHLLDIENKSLTHRPDTFGLIGFAREVAGIEGKQFLTPAWLKALTPEWGEGSAAYETPQVTIADTELCSRYQAVVLTGANNSRQSPARIQSLLIKAGMRPVNAVVDVTNYLMLLTGQPLHAFDYDKLVAIAGGKPDIHVRPGRPGEKLRLLDDREIELTEADIVIVAGKTPVALAGAMGGKATEIDGQTKNIILESATFNLYNLRATQMRHGIFSEAITRFTKGQPAPQTAPVLKEAVRLLGEYADASQASGVGESYARPYVQSSLRVATKQINQILGSTFSVEDISQTLTHVECGIDRSGESISITLPYWRTDLHAVEDVAEEIGRLNGFDTIVPLLPRRDLTAVRPALFDELRAEVRKILARAGANEVLTYSFVHGSLLKKAGQKPEDSYKITNSISPDLQYYRQTLTPSLLPLVHPNSKAGYKDFALFEINKTHNKVHGLDDEGVPGELNMLAFVVTRKETPGASFFQAKHMLEYLGDSLGLSFKYDPIEADPAFPVTAPFDWHRASMVTEAHSGVFIGIVGEYRKEVAKSFKLPEKTAGFELGTEALLKAYERRPKTYRSPSKFPSTERDLCFKVAKTVPYQTIEGNVKAALKEQDIEVLVTPVDIYQSETHATKNITVRLTFMPHRRTLTAEETNQIADSAAKRVLTEVEGELL